MVIGRGCLADKLLSKTIISQAERSNWEWNTSTSDIKSIDPVRRTVEEQVSSHAKSISGNSTPRQLDQLLSRVCIFEYLNYRASYNASYKSISHPFRTTLQQLWIFDLPSDGYENDVCVCVSLYVGRVARGPSRTGIRNLICARGMIHSLCRTVHTIRGKFVLLLCMQNISPDRLMY